MRTVARVLLAVIVACLFAMPLVGCAAAGAGTDSGQSTRSQGAGLWNSDTVEIQTMTVNVGQFPAGMEAWSPEQITAFVAARSQTGPGLLGNVLAGYGGSVTPNTSQAATGGQAEGGRGAGNPILSTDPGTVGNLAKALGDYLGTTNTKPPADAVGTGAGDK